ncbi:hypothetical protein GCM10008961_30340 [Deinococcus knuensis]|uniref:Uncharacterized protein n=1 Tax=Deinococcus knuensis TaxID=1837380 RepID=A0ABQ2SST2_9DEIO|nr:hypothetical protein GCM10008961_30340 [Deinococcus knuensis]
MIHSVPFVVVRVAAAQAVIGCAETGALQANGDWPGMGAAWAVMGAGVVGAADVSRAASTPAVCGQSGSFPHRPLSLAPGAMPARSRFTLPAGG